LPADHKVSVGWQIVATFIIIANFWAFYRIRKLRKYLAYVFVPSIVASVIINAYYYSTLSFAEWGDDGLAFGGPTYQPYMYDVFNSFFWAGIIISVAFQAFAIYLVVKWSREHNRKYGTPTEST
jgi:multisubunit Na+/H+ antiporter MnhC subunit